MAALEKPASDSPGNTPTNYLDRLFHRLHRALGPVAGALILDFADFATFGPVGLLIGWLVGAAAGWWISSLYVYSVRYRVLWSALAALYCTIPFTAVLPLATIISVIARFFED